MEKEFRSYGRQPNSPRLRTWKWIFAAIVLFYVVVYMPTPYVIYTPGSAEEVKPFINVEGGDETEEGMFLLTTVRRTYANLALIAWRAFDPNAEFGKKEDALQGRTEQEYINEQLFNMSNSQMAAVLAAYNQVGIPYEIESEGIYVLFNNKQLADNEFITNDRIMEVEGQKVNGFDDLQASLKGRAAGDTIRAVVEREGKLVEVKANLVELPDQTGSGKKRIGFGLAYGEKKKVVPTDNKHNVTFHESDIGGPSAGLMFTLELINRLTPGDLTKGYRIAGTGTIDPSGKVGPIGGVKHKVVAADREGAVLFLVPSGNYEEAKAKMDKMNTKMKLVKVETLQDALDAVKRFQPAS